ncbi:hypothetical protein P154DRAFT_422299 [Amniculicola lignicola CBS 123094]|uniref:Uncharacterized protein n=1 Tax=Amniculicola lignicola CBS 123094 TaxID=1392246 RepID=A0A6A5X293_9PLEO|nr:hypothetical protein P154DRAFT_422299 [Amniculicola lignicola CBS 123094]
MAASRGHSHGRLHKRGNSASSITSPLSPVSDAGGPFIFNRSETPRTTYEEPWNPASSATTRPMPAASSSHPLKIKPYLRKLSAKDSNALDLSRPAAENESLAGLGISEYTNATGYSRSVSDVSFAPINGRNRHARSTSNTSQFSTTSSLQRPTPPYMPSIRQTPRPYTPPISKSGPSSVMGSEIEPDDIIEDEFRTRQNAPDPARRSGSVSSVPGLSSALRIHTTGSSTRLNGANHSQSTVSLTSPVAPSRSRGDTLRSVDTAASPSSRTSFDKAFGGILRGGRDSPIDASSRAASIRAARQAFQEKEVAQERKYEKEANKQAEREQRKLYKKEERVRRKSDAQERVSNQRARSASDSNNEKLATPRPSVGGRQYSDHRLPHTSTLPSHVITVNEEKRVGTMPHVTKSRAAKGRWLRFVTWFKTRILRMSKKLHVAA